MQAPLSYAMLLREALAARCSPIEGVCFATPDTASRALAARRFAINGVCLATPDPRSKTYASRALAARRFAIKGVCLAAVIRTWLRN